MTSLARQMRIINPYARRVRTFARAGARANPYMRLGTFAWQNRHAIGTMARKMAQVRAMRKMRTRKVSYRGHRVHNTPRKATQCTEVRESPLTTVSYFINGFPIIFTNTGTNRNSRNSKYVNFRGIKICWNFNHVENGAFNKDWIVHWALVKAKDKSPTSFAQWKLDIQNTFFRDNSITVDNVSPFPNPVATYDMKYTCNPINPANMDILTRGKRIISAENKANTLHSNRWIGEKYIKINRKVEFAQNSDTVPKYPYYIIYWITATNQGDFVGTDATSRVECEWRTVTYFNDVK